MKFITTAKKSILRISKIAKFEPKVVQISVRNTKSIQNLQGYIFRIL